MDPTYSTDAQEFRTRITTFLQENLPEDWKGIGQFDTEQGSAFIADWRQKLAANSLLCLLYTSPSPRDRQKSRMPSSA